MHKDLASEDMEFHSVTPDSLITVVQGIHDGITSHNFAVWRQTLYFTMILFLLQWELSCLGGVWGWMVGQWAR